MVLKQMLLRITQSCGNDAESEKVLSARCQELRNNGFRRWDHVFFLNNQFGTGFENHFVFCAIARDLNQDLFRIYSGGNQSGTTCAAVGKP